jgi:hypothetical protein
MTTCSLAGWHQVPQEYTAYIFTVNFDLEYGGNVRCEVPTAVTTMITGHDLNESNTVYTQIQYEVHSLNFGICEVILNSHMKS